MSARSDYVAVAICILYILIAASYLFYNLFRHRSSRAWEKLEELLALAHGSKPMPHMLENTCAGIDRKKTKGQLMKVLVVERVEKIPEEIDERREEEEAENQKLVREHEGLGEVEEEGNQNLVREHEGRGEEQLQMVFVDESGEGQEIRSEGRIYGKVKVDAKYGKIE